MAIDVMDGAKLIRWLINQERAAGTPSRTMEDRCVFQRGDWSVLLFDAMEPMTAFVNENMSEIYLCAETWDILGGHGPAVLYFIADMTGGGSGMRFMVADVGPYADAVQAAVVEVPGDRLARLLAAANGLTVQAAQLNRSPSEMQLQSFAVRAARLQRELDVIELTVAEVRDRVRLAGTAVMETVAS